ncbi:MAG: protein kinase, partial [Planctomycetaceae bacterium]|nr:protein kinase [Planctomycetaceae bacterium]
MMSACPEQSQLVEWLEAAIGEEDRARIESHISSCPACQQKLEHISAHFEETRTMLHSEQATTRNQLNSELVARIADLLAVPQPRTAAPPGDFPKITGYEIQKMIAHGGMGVVYLARQTAANRLVALKLMLHGSTSTQEEVQRFQIESRAAARLTHQYIVPIYEVGTSNGRPFFSMGYVNGSSLKQLLDAGPLPCREAAEIVMQMASAINYAHQEGVLHRDLKPGNILIDREGRPHLTDFGLAKLAEENEDLTLTGQILGTPSYMAPEQARGDLSQIGPA